MSEYQEQINKLNERIDGLSEYIQGLEQSFVECNEICAQMRDMVMGCIADKVNESDV